MKHLLLTIVCLIAWTTLPAQDMRQDTYCNPLNIDYTYMIYNSDRDISYRSGADPAVVEFRGEILYVRNALARLLAFQGFIELGVCTSR